MEELKKHEFVQKKILGRTISFIELNNKKIVPNKWFISRNKGLVVFGHDAHLTLKLSKIRGCLYTGWDCHITKGEFIIYHKNRILPDTPEWVRHFRAL